MRQDTERCWSSFPPGDETLERWIFFAIWQGFIWWERYVKGCQIRMWLCWNAASLPLSALLLDATPTWSPSSNRYLCYQTTSNSRVMYFKVERLSNFWNDGEPPHSDDTLASPQFHWIPLLVNRPIEFNLRDSERMWIEYIWVRICYQILELLTVHEQWQRIFTQPETNYPSFSNNE